MAARKITKKPSKAAKALNAPKSAAATISAWEDDPDTSEHPNSPISLPAPVLAGPLAVAIRGKAPAPRKYAPGTKEFRYWTAAEALGRASQFWASIVPAGTKWFTGARLPITLDAGVDLNAYYDRTGLSFFHKAVKGQTVFSGESPDVACHELGHAVLDALRPELWDTNSAEPVAFHESFGDISAILSALQLKSLRAEVLQETGGQLYRTSRVSRLAEQLGWAIRQQRRDAADPDCLRNAVNSFFYRDPETLPPTAPASSLSSEPHSLSRVFTGAFFEALAGMVPPPPHATSAALQQASKNIAHLVVAAVGSAPIVPGYFSQVAAHMVAADVRKFGGRNAEALKSAFMRHGVLSLEAAVGLQAPTGKRSLAAAAATAAGARRDVRHVPLPGERYGFAGKQLLVQAPASTKTFAVASAALTHGSVGTPSTEDATRSYVEDLFRRGRVDVTQVKGAPDPLKHPFSRKTHRLVPKASDLVLQRRCFDCGFDTSGY